MTCMATRKKTPVSDVLSQDFAGQPAVVDGAQQPSTRLKSKTVLAAEDLIPVPQHTVEQARYRYWIGVVPSCPVECITMAGLAWPKVNERVVADPRRTGQKRRLPVVGSIVWIDEERMRILREVLPRTIVRMLSPLGKEVDSPNLETVSDNVARPKRGHLITIPKPGTASRGRGYNYDAERDLPAAQFMFAQLCDNQEQPQRGEFYPDTLDKTGLEWPDEL